MGSTKWNKALVLYGIKEYKDISSSDEDYVEPTRHKLERNPDFDTSTIQLANITNYESASNSSFV